MLLFLTHLIFLLHIGAAVSYGLHLYRGTPGAVRVGRLLLVAAVAVSLPVAVRQGFVLPARDGQFGAFEGLLSFSFALGALALIGVITARVPQVALVSTPLAAVCAVIAAFVTGDTPPQVSPSQSPFPVAHVQTGLWGYTSFFLVGVVSVFYLIQDRNLKRRRPNLERFPSLQQMDQAQFVFLVIGFVLFTVGIITGGQKISESGIASYYSDVRMFLAVVTWIVYAVLLAARLSARLRGKRVAWLSLVGILLVVVTFVTEVFWPGWHNFEDEEEAKAGQNPVHAPELQSDGSQWTSRS